MCVSWIAGKLRKTDSTGKAYSDDPPSHGSLTEFFAKVDADPDWFPGKHNGQKRGPQPLMTKAKRARIAASGMSQPLVTASADQHQRAWPQRKRVRWASAADA